MGIILFWNSPYQPVSLYGTAAILLIAYIGILLPYPIRYAVARLRQISGSLDDAARVAGAGQMQALRHVTLPLMAPSLIAITITSGILLAVNLWLARQGSSAFSG